MAGLKKLFEPIKIGNIEVKNRIAMSPMDVGFAEDGYSGEKYKHFLEERAKGGVGLIAWPLWPYRTEHGYCPWIWHDKFIPGLRKVNDAVHSHGAKTIAQLGVGYSWAFDDRPVEIIGPSSISLMRGPGTPFRVGGPSDPKRMKERPLTIDEIHQMVGGYGDAARRTREAGFDGVNIMAGAGYTLARFISPLTNKRTDEYGGSLGNRMRIIGEIVDDIKKKAGADYTITCRIACAQFIDGGYTLEDFTGEIAPILGEMGIAAIDVTTGWHEAGRRNTYVASAPEGAYIHLAEAVKKSINIPIIYGGRTNDPRTAEEAIAQRKFDMITFAKMLLAEPELANKAKEGRFEDIRPCIFCARCLDYVDSPVICSVNPRLGREGEYTIEPAQKSKRVFVIGSGPGGMEAALVAAERGHRVTLYEKSDKLGGQLHSASAAPYKGDTAKLRDYFAHRVEKSDIQVKLNTEVDLDTIKAGSPDAVVVAAGANPIIPDIPGVMRLYVVTGVDVLLGRCDVGERVVIIGGGMVGCETAEFLAQKGKKVIIVEMLSRIAADVARLVRLDLMGRLREARVQMETNVEVSRISEHGVWGKRKLYESHGGDEVFFEADTVVLAVGMRANNELARQLAGKVPQLYNIGDSAQPQKIWEAIMGGFLAAREI